VPRSVPEFIAAHTRTVPVPFLPELLLYQADEPIGLWELTEGEYHSESPPPFWAFAWAGGQGLARYLLDHPDVVAGRTVLDLASGSGLVAVAAARAGAAAVRAVDVDPVAAAAIGLNAAANAVAVLPDVADILDQRPDGAAVVLAGDAFYSRDMAARMLLYLRRCRRAGARVLVGDPGRAYFPAAGFTRLARYEVPAPVALEDAAVKPTTVWELV